MRGATAILLALVTGLALPGAPAPAGAEETEGRRLDELERRVEELEAEARDRDDKTSSVRDAYAELPSAFSDWARRVRLEGSANAGWFYGETDSVVDGLDFAVWDARFFVDADLGGPAELGDTEIVRNAGFTFEWDLVRLGQLQNRVGELYAEMQGLLGSPWANLQVGRFQLPVGENYLRFSRGYRDNPFISNTVGGPWYWDEGLKLYGSGGDGRFGYVASLTDGETPFNVDGDSDKQVTLKLFADPVPWLHVSASALRSGRIGSASRAASASLWLGESWARAFGAGTAVPNFVGGVAVPDGPNVLRDTYLLGADVVLQRPRWGRLWLAYGAWWLDSNNDAGVYDTRLDYWIVELVLEGALAHPALEPFTLGLRAHGLGTYDHDRGYLLDVRYAGSLGYNMESLTSYDVVVGWNLTRWLRLRAEYRHLDVDLVAGVPAAIRRAANSADQVAIEVGIHF